MAVQVERRLEADNKHDPDYANLELSADDIAANRHRDHIGGLWETMGRLQRDFLIEQGLRPEHNLLDVGCGSLRAGQQFVDYLEPGRYHGIDVSPAIIEAGYEHELTSSQRSRLPLANLHSTDRFDCRFGETRFDFAIAQSVFTHIPLNLMRLCVHRVAEVMQPGGRFFVTYFEQRPKAPVDRIGKVGRNVVAHSDRNTYWYYRRDLRWIIEHMPWSYRYVGDWGHPRGQRIVEYTRTG